MLPRASEERYPQSRTGGMPRPSGSNHSGKRSTAPPTVPPFQHAISAQVRPVVHGQEPATAALARLLQRAARAPGSRASRRSIACRIGGSIARSRRSVPSWMSRIRLSARASAVSTSFCTEEGFAVASSVTSAARREAHHGVVDGVVVLDLRYLVGNRVRAPHERVHVAVHHAAGGAVGDAGRRPARNGGRDEAHDLAAEDAGMRELRVVEPDADLVRVVPAAAGRRDRDQLGSPVVPEVIANITGASAVSTFWLAARHALDVLAEVLVGRRPGRSAGSQRRSRTSEKPCARPYSVSRLAVRISSSLRCWAADGIPGGRSRTGRRRAARPRRSGAMRETTCHLQALSRRVTKRSEHSLVDRHAEARTRRSRRGTSAEAELEHAASRDPRAADGSRSSPPRSARAERRTPAADGPTRAARTLHLATDLHVETRRQRFAAAGERRHQAAALRDARVHGRCTRAARSAARATRAC